MDSSSNSVFSACFAEGGIGCCCFASGLFVLKIFLIACRAALLPDSRHSDFGFFHVFYGYYEAYYACWVERMEGRMVMS